VCGSGHYNASECPCVREEAEMFDLKHTAHFHTYVIGGAQILELQCIRSCATSWPRNLCRSIMSTTSTTMNRSYCNLNHHEQISNGHGSKRQALISDKLSSEVILRHKLVVKFLMICCPMSWSSRNCSQHDHSHTPSLGSVLAQHQVFLGHAERQCLF
jgi:hypothetical protein